MEATGNPETFRIFLHSRVSGYAVNPLAIFSEMNANAGGQKAARLNLQYILIPELLSGSFRIFMITELRFSQKILENLPVLQAILILCLIMPVNI